MLFSLGGMGLNRNPLYLDQFEAMLSSEDVIFKDKKLMKINKVVVEGSMAFACYTAYAKFTYKGTENEDVAVFSAVFQKFGKQWKLVHEHRSTGRSPSDPQPEFK